MILQEGVTLQEGVCNPFLMFHPLQEGVCNPFLMFFLPLAGRGL